MDLMKAGSGFRILWVSATVWFALRDKQAAGLGC